MPFELRQQPVENEKSDPGRKPSSDLLSAAIRQVQLRDPEEFPTGDRAREESGAMIHLTHRSDNVEARATG